MEDVLSVYQRPYAASQPVVCFDESNKLLHSDGREPVAAAPGASAKVDYSYEQHGSVSMFMFCEPLRGWRRVAVSAQRCGSDLAQQLKRLVDEDYAQAEKIILVCDNLNTHHAGILYQCYEPAEARRIAERLEWHYTPEHGSWLNMAEIELSVLNRQCLKRRIASAELVAQAVASWSKARNAASNKIIWHFTTADARIKLRRLYPVIKT